jgi:hypothetical protein
MSRSHHLTLTIRARALSDLLLDAPDLVSQSRLSPQLAERLMLDTLTRTAPFRAEIEVTLESGEVGPDGLHLLHQAVSTHFGFLAEICRRERRLSLQQGIDSARLGLFFLIVVLGIAEIIGYFEGRISDILSEGLTVLAWVALWRPTEELVYDWYPHTRKLRRILSLKEATVRLIPPIPSSLTSPEP